MQSGLGPSGAKHQLCGTALPLDEDFPTRLAPAEKDAAGADDVLVFEPRSDKIHGECFGWWRIGTQPQCDFLFTPDARLLGYDDGGYAIVRDKKRNREWKLTREKNKWICIGR
jgi:hypothetical protein